MRKLYVWREDGNWEIYQGKYALAIGYDDLYDCFGRQNGDGKPENKVRWDEKGLTSHPYTNVYVGQYKGKRGVQNIVKKIDATLESDKVFYIESDNKEVPSQTMTLSTKRKGVIVVLQKGNISDRLHEEGHIKHNMHGSARSNHYNDELPAIKYQIGELSQRKLWNKRLRNKAIENLSSYSRIPYQKKRRAARDIKRIETQLGICN